MRLPIKGKLSKLILRKHEMLKCFAIWTSLLLISISYGNAASVREVSLNEMLKQSQFVFEGTVTAIETKENSQKRIHTYITFQIKDIIKGKYHTNTITLRFVGGTVGDISMAVSDMQLPQEGEHGIYFVESLDRFQVNPLYGWSQGHFFVELDDSGIGRVMTNKRLPITAVIDDAQDERMRSRTKSIQAPSRGVARGLVYEHGKKGLTVDEFKRALHERFEKEND